MAVASKKGGGMDWDSLIFIPQGGRGEFADIAATFRAAPPVSNLSRIVAIPHSCVEWVDVAASHLGLEAMDARGYFVPLALVPLSPFIDQPHHKPAFRSYPLFRLSWYGHPVGGGT
jgi:hypothetical protein